MTYKLKLYIPRFVRFKILLIFVSLYTTTPEWVYGESNLHLFGALVAEPCVIPPGEEDITLDFGTIVDKYIYQNGRTSSESFNLHLTECDLSLGKTVKATFMGTESNTLPGFLALNVGSQASGVAIGLETQQGKQLLINETSEQYILQEGENLISLNAYVQGEPEAIRNKDIGRGSFSATATFSLEYE
ncbi:fimbrial protein [Klebsiella aerogenes]